MIFWKINLNLVSAPKYSFDKSSVISFLQESYQLDVKESVCPCTPGLQCLNMTRKFVKHFHFWGATVAQSMGTWLGNQRVQVHAWTKTGGLGLELKKNYNDFLSTVEVP